MSATPSTLRQAIVTSLETALPAWRESGFVYDEFPDLESDPLLDRSFAVGVLSTATQPGHQRTGVVCETTFGVRFAVQMSADAGVDDYDRALGFEAALMAAVAAVKEDQKLPLRITSVPTRLVTGGGTVFIGEITCVIAHIYPLTS